MKSHSILVKIALIPIVFFAATLCSAQTNETLFEQCKSHERFKADKASATLQDMTRSLVCQSYIGGAFQMHNLATNGECKNAPKNAEVVVSDYLSFSRKGGGFLDQPQQMVVYMLFESCYCNREPASQAFCPATAK